MLDPEKRKKIKDMIGVEIRSYLDRLTPTSKFATFEVADWQDMLEDVMHVVENEEAAPIRRTK